MYKKWNSIPVRHGTLREGERVCRSPHPPQAVPLPLEGKDNSALDIGARFFLSGATLPTCGERSVAAKSDRGRVLIITSAGEAKPIAGSGGLEGFTPPHH